MREANARADAGDLRRQNVAALLQVLEDFESVFAVLADHDAAKRGRQWRMSPMIKKAKM